MKTNLLILIVLLGFNCSQKQYRSTTSGNDAAGISEGGFQKDPGTPEVPAPEYEATSQISTEYEDRIRQGLKELSDSNVFSIRHAYSISKLDSIQQVYFTEKPEYELLFHSKGDLFQNNLNDYVFIIYDKLNQWILISLYNDLKKDYLIVYQDLKVEYGIHSDECDYYTSRSLDFQIGNELIWLKDSFINNPESLSEYSMCEITDITDRFHKYLKRANRTGHCYNYACIVKKLIFLREQSL